MPRTQQAWWEFCESSGFASQSLKQYPGLTWAKNEKISNGLRQCLPGSIFVFNKVKGHYHDLFL